MRLFVVIVLMILWPLSWATVGRTAGEDRGNRCSASFRALTGKDAWVEDQVSILFFPIKHSTGVKIGDTVYSLNDKFTAIDSHAYRAFVKRASQNRGSSFAEFGIRVTQEEMQSLKQYFTGDTGLKLTCTYVACRPLRKHTGMMMPLVPSAVTPLANAIHLTASRLLPGGRVSGISFEGSYLSLAAVPVGGLMEASAATPFVIIGFASVKVALNGIKKNYLIPLLGKDHKDDRPSTARRSQ